MRKFLLWSFERGSIQYDVICVIIIAFIALAPPSLFNDRPDFMRVPENEAIRVSSDNDGNTVFTVKVDAAAFSPDKAVEQAALDRLRDDLGEPFKVARMQPIYDTIGLVVAYSIWIER